MRGHLRQGVQAAATALRRFDRRKGRALTVTPEFYDLEFESVRLATADGLFLSGWFVPGRGSSRPGWMALLHHHYGGQKAALLPWIELFHQLGLSVLAFDARDHAGSPCPRHRGSYVQRFADVRAGLTELTRRGAEKVIAYGQSQGAAVVIGGLAERRELAGVIVDSGPSASALLSLWGLARSLGEGDASWGAVPSGVIVGELLRRMRPATYPLHLWRGLLRLRDRPLLWLHGTDDRVLPRPWSSLWYEPLRVVAPSWRLEVVPGAQHAECLQQGGAVVERAVAALIDAAVS